jgi:hypothetical protein
LLLPVKPEENNMSIFLQELEHGKENDGVHDKADNHPGCSLETGKKENDIGESIRN